MEERLRGLIEGEADFDGDLPVVDLAVCQVTASFHNFKPTKIANGI
jgi:hypothetical protein